jgi:transposase
MYNNKGESTMATQYTEEFRQGAVKLVIESKESLAHVAKDLGVNNWTLREWVKNHRKKMSLSEPVRPESIEEENRRLKRENAILRQEREILKKAAAFFAKEQL